MSEHKEFFDTVLQYPLDKQQRHSIVSETENCLVVSSVGRGKTSSIVGNVRYLIDKLHVDPTRILLISYTNKAATELTERIYASRSGTHLDFLIYSHVTKKPVLAIETDGFSFHNAHAEQHGRDIKKDNILKKYGVALLRLSTIGSNEKQKIIEALHKAALLYP